jgi:hypothetical protein
VVAAVALARAARAAELDGVALGRRMADRLVRGRAVERRLRLGLLGEARLAGLHGRDTDGRVLVDDLTAGRLDRLTRVLGARTLRVDDDVLAGLALFGRGRGGHREAGGDDRGSEHWHAQLAHPHLPLCIQPAGRDTPAGVRPRCRHHTERPLDLCQRAVHNVTPSADDSGLHGTRLC